MARKTLAQDDQKLTIASAESHHAEHDSSHSSAFERCSGNCIRHGLWLSGKDVVDIGFDANGNGFPPEPSNVEGLTYTIRELARAAGLIAKHAANDEFDIQTVESIADAIVILSSLSEGIQTELNRQSRQPGSRKVNGAGASA